MTYKSYRQIQGDISYARTFAQHRFDRVLYVEQDYDPRHHIRDDVEDKSVNQLRRIWLRHVQDKYKATKNSAGSLGKFLSKYSLRFKEFQILCELIDENNSDNGMFIFKAGSYQDVFKKFRMRYESSALKRHKLIYKIVDPLKPMLNRYEVSYKAQLELHNKKYTDAYQQLDLALEEQAKRSSPDQLESLYYIIKPKTSFQDLIASEELHNHLRIALSREQKKDQIFKNWGFDRVVEYGRGTTLNFRGPSGTGKTLAAHCLAKELGKQLLMVRYDQLQNMYVGETEKHIQQVFKMAKVKNAVLFFDEADAIALSRASLEKSWEMSQVNTLLKELERFEGVCVFATNFSDKYDEAFERRLTMHLDFELPTEEQANLILKKVLPKKARAKEDFSNLPLNNMSGGDIKNVALNAAGFAAAGGATKIGRKHVEQAISLVRHGKGSEIAKEAGYFG